VTLTDRPTQLLVTPSYSEMETDAGRPATSGTSSLTNSAYTALEEALHNLDQVAELSIKGLMERRIIDVERALTDFAASFTGPFAANLERLQVTNRRCMRERVDENFG